MSATVALGKAAAYACVNVWTAALLASSEEAYAATLDTYRHGLGTLIDLLTAERDLASARSIAIASKADLLTAAAALTLAIGAIPLGAR